MKTPKTIKGYLKLLIQISSDSVFDLKGELTDEDQKFISEIRASIQNYLGDDPTGLLEKNNLKWEG